MDKTEIYIGLDVHKETRDPRGLQRRPVTAGR
jgi:hypothetical protein